MDIVVRTTAPADLPQLHELLADPMVGTYWRSRGRPVSQVELQHLLFQDSLATATVLADGVPAGVGQVYGFDGIDGTAQLSVAMQPSLWLTGALTRCLRHVIELARQVAPVRLAYAMMAAPASARVERTLRMWGITPCGALPAHVYMDGTHHDLVLWSLSVDQLRDRLGASAAASRGPSPAGATRTGDAAEFEDVLAALCGKVGVSDEAPLFGGIVDSLGAQELIAAMERTCRRALADDLFAALETVGDARRFLETQVGTAP